MTLVPAYGRDYKSLKEVKAAWESGKDFQINDIMSPDDGRFINCHDVTAEMFLNIRYKNKTNIYVFKAKPKKEKE